MQSNKLRLALIRLITRTPLPHVCSFMFDRQSFVKERRYTVNPRLYFIFQDAKILFIMGTIYIDAWNSECNGKRGFSQLNNTVSCNVWPWFRHLHHGNFTFWHTSTQLERRPYSNTTELVKFWEGYLCISQRHSSAKSENGHLYGGEPLPVFKMYWLHKCRDWRQTLSIDKRSVDNLLS